MRGAATAELLRCAEPLRSVGAVDCDSNTTMVAHRGTLDCATSLSSSTADLQRRTWGMHCAGALVSGFAGAASAPRRAPACVHLRRSRESRRARRYPEGEKRNTLRENLCSLLQEEAAESCRQTATQRET